MSYTIINRRLDPAEKEELVSDIAKQLLEELKTLGIKAQVDVDGIRAYVKEERKARIYISCRNRYLYDKKAYTSHLVMKLEKFSPINGWAYNWDYMDVNAYNIKLIAKKFKKSRKWGVKAVKNAKEKRKMELLERAKNRWTKFKHIKTSFPKNTIYRYTLCLYKKGKNAVIANPNTDIRIVASISYYNNSGRKCNVRQVVVDVKKKKFFSSKGKELKFANNKSVVEEMIECISNMKY